MDKSQTQTVVEVVENYKQQEYRKPDGYTSDVAVFTVVNELIESKKPPQRALKLMLVLRSEVDNDGNANIEGGKWSLPGGIVNPNENAFDAAKRELVKETGVDGILIKHFGVYDAPGRDSRGWVISIAHYAIVTEDYLEKRKASENAEEVRLFTMEEIKKLNLAFDHKEIISAAYEVIRKDMLQTTVVREFLPNEFTLTELQQVLLTVTDSPKVSKYTTFRNRTERLSFIELVKKNGINKTTSRHSKKPSNLYRFRPGEPIESIYF